MTNNAWPDPENLGLPLNPEMHGHHWLDFGKGPELRTWDADDKVWYEFPERFLSGSWLIAEEAKYIGPVVPPSEQTTITDGAMADRKMVVKTIESVSQPAYLHNESAPYNVGYSAAIKHASEAIQSLPLPEAPTIEQNSKVDPFEVFVALADNWALEKRGVNMRNPCIMVQELRAAIETARGK